MLSAAPLSDAARAQESPNVSEPTAAPAKAKSKKLIIIVAALAVLLVAGGAAAWLLLGKRGGGDEEEGHAPVAQAAAPKTPPTFLPMENMVVNLADPGGRRFLKATITIEVPPLDFFFPVEAVEATATPAAEGAAAAEDPRTAEFTTLIDNKMPIINDILNTLLTSKTFDQIYTVEGKEALREEIKKEINARLPELGVIAVYFTEFVVQ